MVGSLYSMSGWLKACFLAPTQKNFEGPASEHPMWLDKALWWPHHSPTSSCYQILLPFLIPQGLIPWALLSKVPACGLHRSSLPRRKPDLQQWSYTATTPAYPWTSCYMKGYFKATASWTVGLKVWMKDWLTRLSVGCCRQMSYKRNFWIDKEKNNSHLIPVLEYKDEEKPFPKAEGKGQALTFRTGRVMKDELQRLG